MAHTACLVYLVSTVSGHCKNASGKGSASSQHITYLSNLLFLLLYLLANENYIKLAAPFKKSYYGINRYNNHQQQPVHLASKIVEPAAPLL
jgi:hypothetical protein